MNYIHKFSGESYWEIKSWKAKKKWEDTTEITALRYGL
jgi:hypothetical protein